MKKPQETVNVVVSKKPAIEGNDYYFLSGTDIERGTCVRCEKCQKACISNSVKIVSFNTPNITIAVNDEMKDAQELGYDEATDLCLCEDCA